MGQNRNEDRRLVTYREISQISKDGNQLLTVNEENYRGKTRNKSIPIMEDFNIPFLGVDRKK